MDAHSEDPYEHLASRSKWTCIVRRVRFGRRSKTREIALLLASYGNSDGTRNFPGIKRLAAVGECSERTVGDALDTLRALGLLTRVTSGSASGRPSKGKKPRNDEHLLTIPPDLEHRVDLLPEDESDEEREEKRRAERRADAERRRAKRQAAKKAAAALKPPGEDSAEPSGNPREDSANPSRTPNIRGKLERYQGKASAVTGESYAGNRGKLRPDIPKPTSEDAAYQVIRPQVYRPGTSNDHPAPCVAGQRASSQAEEPLPDDLASIQERIADALGGLTIAEESEVRGRLVKNDNPIAIIRAIRKDRGSAA